MPEQLRISVKNPPTAQLAYDRELALRRLNGELSLFRDLVGFYFEDSGRYLDEGRLHLTGEGLSDFARAMHRLRGLASNFEARPLVDAVQLAEDAARGSQLEEAKRLFVIVEQEVERLRDALEGDRRLDVA